MANQGQVRPRLRPPPLPSEEVPAHAVPTPPVSATVEEAFKVKVTSNEVKITSDEVKITSSEVAVTAVNEDH